MAAIAAKDRAAHDCPIIGEISRVDQAIVEAHVGEDACGDLALVKNLGTMLGD